MVPEGSTHIWFDGADLCTYTIDQTLRLLLHYSMLHNKGCKTLPAYYEHVRKKYNNQQLIYNYPDYQYPSSLKPDWYLFRQAVDDVGNRDSYKSTVDYYISSSH